MFVKVIKQIWAGYGSSFYPAYRMTHQEIVSLYSRSKMGILWEVIDPFMLALAFILLRSSSVLSLGETSIPYALFVLTGMVSWQAFTEALTKSIGIMKKMSQISGTVKLNPQTVIIHVVMRVLFNSTFRFLVISLVALFMGGISVMGLLFGAVTIVGLTLIGAGIGFFLAPFNTIYSDFGIAINVMLRPLMFISHVIFPLPKEGAFEFVWQFNFIAGILAEYRHILALGSVETWSVISNFFVITLFLFALGNYAFHVTYNLITEKV